MPSTWKAPITWRRTKPAKSPTRCYLKRCARAGSVGVAKIAMHNREHIVILRPGPKGVMLAYQYYPDEIRQVEEFRTDISLVKEKELAMAKSLIDSLLGPIRARRNTTTNIAKI